MKIVKFNLCNMIRLIAKVSNQMQALNKKLRLLIFLFMFSLTNPAYSLNDNEIDTSKCNLNMQNLDEVVAAQIQGKVTQHCFSLAAEHKYWPIGVPNPPTAIEKKYTPKGRSYLYYANYYSRDKKIVSSKAEADVDGKQSHSFQIKRLVTVMEIRKTQKLIPLCEVVTSKVQFVKEPWGWFLMAGNGPPGFDVKALISNVEAPSKTNIVLPTDSPRDAENKKARDQRRQHYALTLRTLDSQCNKSL